MQKNAIHEWDTHSSGGNEIKQENEKRNERGEGTLILISSSILSWADIFIFLLLKKKGGRLHELHFFFINIKPLSKGREGSEEKPQNVHHKLTEEENFSRRYIISPNR